LGYSEPPTYARPVLISLAETYLKAKDYIKAIETYQALLKRHPNTANGYYGLYKVYKQKGDKTNEQLYAQKLAEVIKFGDKSLYPL
jgi:predicted Zn-dependent protease